MLGQRERLKTAIRHYFEENGIVASGFPTTRIPPPKIGEETEVDIGGQKVPMNAAVGRNIAVGSCASMASLVLPLANRSRDTGAQTIPRKCAGADCSAEDLMPVALRLQLATTSRSATLSATVSKS
jgi:mandelamide amidase